MNKSLRVKCPQCETEFAYYDSEFRPFCCERCRLIDLGHWFKESYRVPEKDKTSMETNEQNQSENENEKDPENYEQAYDEDDYNESDYE